MYRVNSKTGLIEKRSNYGDELRKLINCFDDVMISMSGTSVSPISIWLDLGIERGFITEEQAETYDK